MGGRFSFAPRLAQVARPLTNKERPMPKTVKLKVRKDDLLVLRFALAYDRDARYQELGQEVAEETDEVRILRHLILQLDLHLAELPEPLQAED
jgi:hypothetical protein